MLAHLVGISIPDLSFACLHFTHLGSYSNRSLLTNWLVSRVIVPLCLSKLIKDPLDLICPFKRITTLLLDSKWYSHRRFNSLSVSWLSDVTRIWSTIYKSSVHRAPNLIGNCGCENDCVKNNVLALLAYFCALFYSFICRFFPRG